MSATCSVPVSMAGVIHRPAALTRRSGMMSLTIRLVGAGGMFLCHVVLARSLGVGAFGEYSLAIAWLQVLTVFGKLGLDNTSLRYVSEYVTRSETEKLQGFLFESVRASFIASLVVSTLVLISVACLWQRLGREIACCLILAGIIVPIVSIRQIQEASLRGVGKLFESQIGTAIWPLLLCLLTGITWHFTGSAIDSSTAMILHLISLFAVMVLVYLFYQSLPVHRGDSTARQSCYSVWKKTALAFLFAETLIAFKGRACIALAGVLLDRPSVGLYGAMEKFADVSLLLSQSLGIVIAPQFASLYAAGRFADMRKLMRQGELLGLAFTLPVAISVGCLGEYVFMLLGPDYRDGWPVLIALLSSACIASFSGPGAYVLQMTGRERTVLAITAMCAVTNILLTLTLIGPFGILGLGLAQMVTSLVWTTGIRGALFWHPVWNVGRELQSGEFHEVSP